MSCCGNIICTNLATKKCKNCLQETYCSKECQLNDWPIHKLICPFIKNNDQLLPFSEVNNIIVKFLKISANIENSNDKLKILKYSLSFAEFQFGNRIEGKSRRIRNNIWISNEFVELDILCKINSDLGVLYFPDENKIKDNIYECSAIKSIYYFENILTILNYWQTEHNKLKDERIENINDNIINKIYKIFGVTKEKLGLCYQNLHDFDRALANFDESISYIRFTEEQLWKLLEYKARCFYRQEKFNEAKDLISTSYNILAKKYDPCHVDNLRVGNTLIRTLIQTGELYDAERYAQVAYELLTRPIDPESLDVADAAEIYARVTYYLIEKNGYDSNDLTGIIKIELLCRKALQIMDRLFGSIYIKKRNLLVTLYNTLRLKNANLSVNAEENNLLKEITSLDIHFNV
jgi:tetratricopeptide (TPR) repeat protein